MCNHDNAVIDYTYYTLYYFFLFLLFVNALTSNNIPFAVMSGFIFGTDQSATSLLFTTEYTPRTVVRMVNIFHSLMSKIIASL
jgi:hypothetical protein